MPRIPHAVGTEEDSDAAVDAPVDRPLRRRLTEPDGVDVVGVPLPEPEQVVGRLLRHELSRLARVTPCARRATASIAVAKAALMLAAAEGVLDGLTAPRIARRIGIRVSLLTALAAFMALHLLMGLFSSAALAGLALFVEAAGGMLWNVVTVSYRQRLIPDELLGRVNAVYRFFSWGAMPFGSLAAGALVSVLELSVSRGASLHGPYLLGAVVCGGLLLYATLRLRFDG